MELDPDEQIELSCGCSPDNSFPISLKEVSIDEDMAYQGMGFPSQRESGKEGRNLRDPASQTSHRSQTSKMSSVIGIPKDKRSSRRAASSM